MAKVHTLFGNSPQISGEQAAAAALSNPLVADLKDVALGILNELVRRMFDSADDSLFESGEKASSDVERRRYFDAMRVLRLNRRKIESAFADHVAHGFVPVAVEKSASSDFDLDNLSIQPTDAIEEKIAIINMAAKAEGLYKNLIWELERHLDFAARTLGVPVSPKALDPKRICEAFSKGTAPLDVELKVKLVIFKLFDRVIIAELGRVYTAALEVMTRAGVSPTRQSTGAGSEPADTGAAVGQSYDQAQTQARDLLRRYGLDSASLKSAGSQVGAEIAGMLQTLIYSSAVPATQVSTQRLSLAGRLFDDLLAEPMLPDALRLSIEKLRYPVYKTALTDPSFFANQQHPVRRLLNDMVELALAAQTSDAPNAQLRETMRMASALQQSQGPALAAEALIAAHPFSERDVENFLLQVRERTHLRRDSLLTRVRRQVAQELELQTLGRAVPGPVMSLLRSGVGPLIAVRLLKNGRESASYQDAQSLMEGVLKSLDFIPPASPEELMSRERLLSTIVTSLADIGMAADKVEALLNGLLGVYQLLEHNQDASARSGSRSLSKHEENLLRPGSDPATAHTGQREVAAAQPAAGMERMHEAGAGAAMPSPVLDLLRHVLIPESWFRVYEPESNQTRWLKLNSFYPEHDSVTFTGFDESLKLSISALRFAEHLIGGQSEPINPNESATEAINQLRRREPGSG